MRRRTVVTWSAGQMRINQSATTTWRRFHILTWRKKTVCHLFFCEGWGHLPHDQEEQGGWSLSLQVFHNWSLLWYVININNNKNNNNIIRGLENSSKSNFSSPDHNSTAVLVGDKLYAGTAADYQVPIHCDHCHPAAYAGLPDPGDRDGKLIFNLGSIDNFLDIYIIFLQLWPPKE